MNIKAPTRDPELSFLGFSLWILGRPFPDAQDAFDREGLTVVACCTASGALVTTEPFVLQDRNLLRWLEDLEPVYTRLEGKALLDPYEPYLRVEIAARSLGHMQMRVNITPEPLAQSHEFLFEFDQTLLPSLLGQLRTSLAAFTG
jgi:hypothetical protein